MSKVCSILLLAFFSPALADEFKIQPVEARLKSPAINEASGIAVSPSNPDFLWIINDSGGTPDIHLVGTDGSDRGKLGLKDTKNIDWEDISSFKLDGKSYLLVADTGDNKSVREECVFYIVREPALPADGKSLALTTLPSWQIRFRYQDGPRDCEAVAVDAKEEKIIFISKRTNPPEVYEIPLRAPKKRGVVTAAKSGTTEVKGTSPLPFFDQPTGLDISSDGKSATIVTYNSVFLFQRQPGESWPQAFARKPINLGPHRLKQAESVGFSTDGKTIYATSEGKEPPVRIYQESVQSP